MNLAEVLSILSISMGDDVEAAHSRRSQNIGETSMELWQRLAQPMLLRLNVNDVGQNTGKFG